MTVTAGLIEEHLDLIKQKARPFYNGRIFNLHQ
jgi:hypothetical protein